MTKPPGAGDPLGPLPSDLGAYWMPFTANRRFKAAPRFLVSAEGMYYRAQDGRRILDATAGLWCCNAGHCRAEIIHAIQTQAAELDYGTAFQLGHARAFDLAGRLAALAPAGLDRVFFVNSGSEAVDSALKIARAYHRRRGAPGRRWLIGRARAYHGVNFGGMSVGGIVANRTPFGPLLPEVDHLPHTHDPARNAFSRGQPDYGAERADALEDLVALHGADAIAAVIVEPVAGSTGVLVPPKGYLEALRAICDRHGILLIFDEVITGFGRLGAPFAAQHFGVVPDMITCAKGLTNGAVPMGAVLVRRELHDAFMDGPEDAIELPHGYTCSGHPLAAAAGLATLDLYEREGLFARAKTLAAPFAAALHALRGRPHVIDIRNLGLMGAIELAPRPGAPGARGQEAFRSAFDDQDLLVRVTGDTIALSPPLIVSEREIAQIAARLGAVLDALA